MNDTQHGPDAIEPITAEGLRQLRILIEEGASGYTRHTVASLLAERDREVVALNAATAMNGVHERTIARLRSPTPVDLEDLLDATLAPHAVVTTHGGLHWHVTHPAACDRLPYETQCLFDLARELRGYEQEPPAAEMFIGIPYVAHDHGGGTCGHDCPVLIGWSSAESPTQVALPVEPARGFRLGDLVQITGRDDEFDSPRGMQLNGRTGHVAELDPGADYPIGLTIDGWLGPVWCDSGEIRHADADKAAPVETAGSAT